MDQERNTRVAERIEEAVREIGVLLIAFAPLEGTFSTSPRAGISLLLFLAFGLLLFGGALLNERRRTGGS
jgi:hypothetical protein